MKAPKSKTRYCLFFFLLITLLFSQSAAAQGTTMADFCEALYIIAGFLASVMIVIQGLRWVMSDTPQDRMEAKKGIMYVLIGLLVVYMAAILVSVLYCRTIQGYDENCPDGPDCSIDCSLTAIGGCTVNVVTTASEYCDNICANGGTCVTTAAACTGGAPAGTVSPDAEANNRCVDDNGAGFVCCCAP
ncbi:MAG: pilin [Candidatus Altiarchaeota archaeon]